MRYEFVYITWIHFTQKWNKHFKEQNENNSFKGIDPVRSKIIINRNVTEQIHTFSYQGCSILHQNENDISAEVSNIFPDSRMYYENFKTILNSKTR
jgi:hypothetical protein